MANQQEKTATSIDRIIETSVNELKEMKTTWKPRRAFANVSAKDFQVLFITEAEKIFIRRNRPDIKFEIDDDNKEVLNLLYWYLVGNSEKIDINKGILLIGSIGSGKTIMLLTICKLIELLCSKIITQVHSMKLASEIRANGKFDEYITKPLFIDDLGKEEESIKSWGTDIRPITELIAMRYDTGSWTFATSNFKLETLQEKYSHHTADRMVEMFNIIELKGKSRRK